MKKNQTPDLITSFWTGVFMGLAAPALMLTPFVNRPVPSVPETLAGDWQRIGSDMRTAIGRTRRDAGKQAA